jgi:hypothetical protein
MSLCFTRLGDELPNLRWFTMLTSNDVSVKEFPSQSVAPRFDNRLSSVDREI